MKHNKLYSFIQLELERVLTTNTALQTNRFKVKNNLAGSSFALYELMVSAQPGIKSPQGQLYTLKAHHLSFYEKQKDNNPNLSQYHYTAYLRDSEGTEHQLHVYFDHHDAPKSLALSVAGVELPVNDETHERMVQFALSQSSAVMNELRTQHTNFLEKLETRYNEVEQKLSALSFDLLAHQEAYLALSEEALTVLQPLAGCHYDARYEKFARLFAKVTAAIKLMPLKVAVDVMDSSPRPALADASEAAEEQQELSVVAIKKSLQPLIQEVLAAKNELSRAVLSTQSLAAAHQKITDVFMLTEDERYQTSPNDLQQIHRLFVEIDAKAKKLLLSLLMNKKVSEAEPLQHFVNPIPRKWMQLALNTGNAPMLDFLLTHGDFAINSFVTANTLSPVQFCFKKGASHRDCLSVLIKHNASLMCTAEDGLPIAHHLLIDVQHPLRRALVDNSKTTLGQPRFYKMVIHQLDHYLAQPNINAIEQARLFGAIISYKNVISQLSNSHSAIVQHSVQRQAQLGEQLANHHNIKGAFAEIKKDAEFQEKVHEYESVLADYHKKIPRSSRKQVGQINSNVYENLEMALDFLRPEDQLDIKKQALLYIADQTKAIELRLELWGVQERLKHFNQSAAGRKRVPRAVKQDVLRERALVADIDKLDEKYSFLTTDVKQAKSQFTQLTALFEKVNSLKDNLLNWLAELDSPKLAGNEYLSSLGDLEEITQLVTLEARPTPLLSVVKQPRPVNPAPITARLLLEHGLFKKYTQYEVNKMRVVEEGEHDMSTALVPYQSPQAR